MFSSQIVIGDILPYTQSPATSQGQTVFGTNWTANAASDVVVYYTPLGSSPNDVTQILSYPSQYSVDFIGGQQQVQVTLVTGAVNIGDIVTITRQTPADRENLYTNTNFTPSMLNNDFGILTLVDQQAQLVNQLIGPRYNYSAVITDVVDTILPILGANQTWAKNGSNTAIVPITITPGGGINGTINIGSPGQIAYYAGVGNVLSGLSVVGLSQGGTNASLTASLGAIPYSTASAIALLSPGTSGQLFQSGGDGIPNWTTATYPSTAGTSGNFLRSNGTNIVSSSLAYAYYTGTPTGTISTSFNVATYPTKVTDTANAYSAGTYTIPTTGLYAISASFSITGVSITAGNVSVIQIDKNGSGVATQTLRAAVSNANGTVTNSVCILALSCTAGDTITINSYAQYGTPSYAGGLISSAENMFSIAQLQ